MIRRAALAAAVLLVLSACGSGDGREASAPRTTPSPVVEPAETHTNHTPSATPAKPKPLRAGERRVEVTMPAAYTPSAPTGVGTDDYRCFLLDPKVAKDSFVTGFNVLPGNPDVVHHVILFRVPPDMVGQAEKKDAETPGEGWTCFGTSGLGNDGSIDDAPWLGAWAPGGAEQLYGKGLGEEFPAGSAVVMQVHYNLLAGAEPDTSGAELRLTENPRTKALQTMLLPAPVELPCRSGKTGPLCDRAAALKDVQARFGRGPGSTANYLHVLCGGAPIGPVQSCTREITTPQTIRGVAGHMHLLGKSLKIETNPGTPRARTVLNIPIWNFDDQRSVPTKPIRLAKGDTVRITCRHTQELRDLLPSFKDQPERYVMWGEGTTDEMCLGIVLVTKP
ncbi:hypothetical protein ABIE44_003280 [Marmoricola sp. OAE513]|uniref:hypothetical protein n=1 Tax=Marmoricola sp. OAE513 TaxID=2817894 RepID=UPI001AEA5CF6